MKLLRIEQAPLSVGENVVDLRVSRSVGRFPCPPAMFFLHEDGIAMKKSCGGEEPNKTEPFSFRSPISKLPDPMFLLKWHPNFRIEVAHNKLVEGILVADNLLRSS